MCLRLTVSQIKKSLEARIPGIKCITLPGTALKQVIVGDKYAHTAYSSPLNTVGAAWKDAHRRLAQ